MLKELDQNIKELFQYIISFIYISKNIIYLFNILLIINYYF